MKNLFFFLFLLVLFSCVDRSEVAIPSYVFIDTIQLKSSTGQGSSSSQFKDCWVYVNDSFVGAYEMPIKIPLVHFGKSEIKVFGGIRENGTLSRPVRYDKTAPYSVFLDLVAGKTDSLHPSVEYYKTDKFPFIENFDGTHFFNLDLDGNAQTQIVLSSSNDAYEGSHSGEIVLNKENPLMIAMYNIPKPIPIGPNKVYIELNYKCDVSFSVGFYGFSTGQATKDYVFGTMKPIDSWNKIYFDFTPYIVECSCEEFRIAVYANYDASIAKENQIIYLDNFKVIHQ